MELLHRVASGCAGGGEAVSLLETVSTKNVNVQKQIKRKKEARKLVKIHLCKEGGVREHPPVVPTPRRDLGGAGLNAGGCSRERVLSPVTSAGSGRQELAVAQVARFGGPVGWGELRGVPRSLLGSVVLSAASQDKTTAHLSQLPAVRMAALPQDPLGVFPWQSPHLPYPFPGTPTPLVLCSIQAGTRGPCPHWSDDPRSPPTLEGGCQGLQGLWVAPSPQEVLPSPWEPCQAGRAGQGSGGIPLEGGKEGRAHSAQQVPQAGAAPGSFRPASQCGEPSL